MRRAAIGAHAGAKAGLPQRRPALAGLATSLFLRLKLLDERSELQGNGGCMGAPPFHCRAARSKANGLTLELNYQSEDVKFDQQRASWRQGLATYLLLFRADHLTRRHKSCSRHSGVRSFAETRTPPGV
jgi:hypothetical protein